MRPLQYFVSARCTSELSAQTIVKRFRAFSELPFNLFGSELAWTEGSHSIRPRLDVSSSPQELRETGKTLHVDLGTRETKGFKAVVPPETLAGGATHTGQKCDGPVINMMANNHGGAQQTPLKSITLR